jgi:hypothetical protein
LTMPSQRTSAANSGSAQAIDASAYTRDTPSNIREETAVNQSLHPGFTAPVHGTPPPASLPVPVPAVSSQRAEIMPTLRPQCYTDNPGASSILSIGRIQGATPGIADRQAPSLPEHAPSPRWTQTVATPCTQWIPTRPNVAQSSDFQHAAGSATTSQEVEPDMADNNLCEQNRSSQWRPYDLSWPQDPAVLNSQFNNIMGSEVAGDEDRYTSIEGSWDWNSMIQETYAHLGDGFTG